MDKIEDFEINSPRWMSLEDFEGEIWKDIPGYEGWYKVSNMGRIKSLDREIFYTNSKNKIKGVFTPGVIIKSIPRGVYSMCHLKRNGTAKLVKFHRIVCSVFHPNPDNLPEINHINENKFDNRADNLEWCTRIYNANWGTAKQRMIEKTTNHPNLSKIVWQYTIDGVFIKEYPSANEAERQSGILAENITEVCNNKRSISAGGYLWTYKNDYSTLKKLIQRQDNPLFHRIRKVCQYTIDGEYIQTFPSIKSAATQLHINKDTIGKCCQHKKNQRTAGGYKWEYEDNPQRELLVQRTVRDCSKKRVICTDLEGCFIKVFDSQSAAAKEFGFRSSEISHCCNGFRKSIGKYKFQYEKKENQIG